MFLEVKENLYYLMSSFLKSDFCLQKAASSAYSQQLEFIAAILVSMLLKIFMCVSSPYAKGTVKLHKDLRGILKHKASKNFHTVHICKVVVSSRSRALAVETKADLSYGECQKM